MITGRKCNVPFATTAEWILVYAALEGRPQAFLVRQGAKGLAVGERERNMGLHALPLYELELRDCAVPLAQRLGGEQGADVSLLFDSARVAWAALALGVGRAALSLRLRAAG